MTPERQRSGAVMSWGGRAMLVAAVAWTAAVSIMLGVVVAALMLLAYTTGRLDQTRRCERASHHKRTP